MRPHRASSATAFGLAALLVAFTAGVARVSRGDVVTLAPAKDNTLIQDLSGTSSPSNGQGSLFVGTIARGGDRRRAAIDFDIAGSIPADATIQSVELRLQMTARPPADAGPENVTIGLHRLLADWGEGTSFGSGSGAQATAGDATWTHAFHGVTPWATPGGAFAASASGAATVSGTQGTYAWTSTPAMVADVQGWLAAPATDHGWLLMGNEIDFGTARRFDSGEARTGTEQPPITVPYIAPQLVVTYAIPEPGAAALLLAAGAIGALGRQRRLRH